MTKPIITKELKQAIKDCSQALETTSDVKSILTNTVLSPCTSRHNDICTCQRKLFDAFKLEYATRERIKLKSEGLEDDALTVDIRVKNSMVFSKDEANDFCREHSIVCPYEKREIEQMVKFFLDKYPTVQDDPIFIETVKTVCNLQLIVFRLKLSIGHDGPTITRYDKNDNMYEDINPLLRAQREYESTKLQALTFLDSKLNKQDLNINVTGLSIKDVMNKIIVIENEEPLLLEAEQIDDE